MLCYHYPPEVTSGTARSVAFTTNLPAHGWEPVVLTRKARGDDGTPGVRIERTAEWKLGSLVRLLQGVASRISRVFGVDLRHNYFRDVLCIPDEQIAWQSTLRGARIARQCHVVYATCTPFSSAVSAAFIKRLTGRPLVLDFRDVWAISAYYDRTRLRHWYERRIERYVLEAADVLIANSEGAGRLYRQHYPEFAHQVRVIPNGYDVLNPATPGSSPSDDFVIVHVGTFYGRRSPDALLEALAEIDDDHRIRFVQVGAPFEVPERLRDRVNVEFTGVLPREAALERMRGAALLYLKQRHDDRGQEYVAVAAKTYEYLATGLPILVDCPPGDNRRMVEQYGHSPYVPRGHTARDLGDAVLTAYAERNDRHPRISPTFQREFDRRVLTGRLAEILDEVATR